MVPSFWHPVRCIHRVSSLVFDFPARRDSAERQASWNVAERSLPLPGARGRGAGCRSGLPRALGPGPPSASPRRPPARPVQQRVHQGRHPPGLPAPGSRELRAWPGVGPGSWPAFLPSGQAAEPGQRGAGRRGGCHSTARAAAACHPPDQALGGAVCAPAGVERHGPRDGLALRQLPRAARRRAALHLRRAQLPRRRAEARRRHPQTRGRGPGAARRLAGGGAAGSERGAPALAVAPQRGGRAWDAGLPFLHPRGVRLGAGVGRGLARGRGRRLGSHMSRRSPARQPRLVACTTPGPRQGGAAEWPCRRSAEGMQGGRWGTTPPPAHPHPTPRRSCRQGGPGIHPRGPTMEAHPSTNAAPPPCCVPSPSSHHLASTTSPPFSMHDRRVCHA
uniref:Uncharacterized protein n=1 Tax=Auxenochlorella protothecoides TaxID=3075 RepID=A0A1D2A561_AUXPR